MKHITYMLLLAVGLGGSTLVQAQEPVVPRNQVATSPYERYTTYMLTFRYGIMQPMSGFSEYIDQTSSHNFSLNGEWVRTGSFSFGAQLGSSYFHTRLPRQLYRAQGGADISAVQTRTLDMQTLMATGKYHFAGVNSIVRPYVHAGVGAAFVSYTTYLGSLEAEAKNGFKLATQVGVGSRFLFGSESHWGADVQATYQYVPFSATDVTRISAAGVSVGLFYRWW